jgi:ABC-type transporter Mla subunit MlaD
LISWENDLVNKWVVILSIFVIGLAACSRSLDVVVSFTAAPGLHKGDAVMLDGEQIGKIAKLAHIDQRTKVVLALDPDKAKTLRSNAAAMVVTQDSTHVVEIYNSSTGSSPLVSGHELLAIDSSLEFLAWRAGETLDQTNKQVGEALSSLQDYLSGPEWEQQKKELQEDLTELEQAVGRSSDQARRELESLLDSLENKSKQTAEQLEQQYRALKDDLSELGRDLARQGQENLLPALEEILATLREALEQYQHQEDATGNQKQSS